MVNENLDGGGVLQGFLQPFRTGEGVAVQQDNQIGLLDGGGSLPGGFVVEKIGDGGSPQEVQIFRRRVREDAGDLLAQLLPEIEGHGGRGAQGISVGMGVGCHNHLPGGVHQGLQAAYLLFIRIHGGHE